MRTNLHFGNSINVINDKKTADNQQNKQTAITPSSTNPYKIHTSILHSQQGYNLMKNVANANIGAWVTLAILQTIDNRSLKKNGQAFFKAFPKTLKSVLTIAGGVGAVCLSKLYSKHMDKSLETIAQAHSNTIDFEIRKNEGNI